MATPTGTGPFSSFTTLGEVSQEGFELAGHVPPFLVDVWQQHGTGYLDDGFIRIVDPAVTIEKLKPVAAAGPPWVPIITTALGDVIYAVNQSFVFATFYRYGFTDIIASDATQFLQSLDQEAILDGLLARQPYPERAAQTGIPNLDQCYAYVPMLRMGGQELAANLDLSDMWIHLQISLQLVGPPVERFNQ